MGLITSKLLSKMRSSNLVLYLEKVLIGDIKGVLSDAFSIFKSTLMSVLAFPIKLLTGIFSTVVSIASTLYSIAKFAFTFIYKSLSFIASMALRISGFLLRVVLKVAYKILLLLHL